MRTTAGRAARAAGAWGAPPASAVAPRAHRTAYFATGREECGGPAGQGRASFPHSSQVATPRPIASREAARAPAATASEQSTWRGKSVAPPTPVRMWSAPRRRAVRPVQPPGKSNAETGAVGQASLLATGRAIALGTTIAAPDSGVPATFAWRGRRPEWLGRGAPRLTAIRTGLSPGSCAIRSTRRQPVRRGGPV